MSAPHENIQLPAFITFPKAPPIYIIKDGGTFYYVEGDNAQFEFVSDVENYILTELKGEVSFNSSELSRAEAPHLPYEDRPLNNVIFEADTNHMVVAYTQQDTINALKEDYYEFLDLDREYNDDPDNWAIAYAWLNSHPAFYHRTEPDSAYWEFNEGLEGKWENVYRTKGDIMVVIEHGPAVGDDRTELSHDERLDSTGSTFEEAYIYLAKQVNKHYDIAGTDLGLEEEEDEY